MIPTHAWRERTLYLVRSSILLLRLLGLVNILRRSLEPLDKEIRRLHADFRIS